MKARRQQKILEIINGNSINTQEELAVRLREAGFNATQATISRDIKELRIVKIQSENGYRYFCSAEAESGTRFSSLVSSAVTSVTPAGNIVAIKCMSGMAQAVCAAMDAAEISNVVATIAGDDTIFALCPNSTKAKDVCKELQNLIGR